MSELAAHASLLVTAFLAATILPGSSEALLAGLVLSFPAATITLFLSALAGNTAGAVANWYIGRSVAAFAGRRWFASALRHVERASGLVNRYGSWLLLFSWLPVIGDPLTIAAGIAGIRFPLFLLLVAIGKAARYAVVIAGAELVRQAI